MWLRSDLVSHSHQGHQTTSDPSTLVLINSKTLYCDPGSLSLTFPSTRYQNHELKRSPWVMSHQGHTLSRANTSCHGPVISPLPSLHLLVPAIILPCILHVTLSFTEGEPPRASMLGWGRKDGIEERVGRRTWGSICSVKQNTLREVFVGPSISNDSTTCYGKRTSPPFVA